MQRLRYEDHIHILNILVLAHAEKLKMRMQTDKKIPVSSNQTHTIQHYLISNHSGTESY